MSHVNDGSAGFFIFLLPVLYIQTMWPNSRNSISSVELMKLEN